MVVLLQTTPTPSADVALDLLEGNVDCVCVLQHLNGFFQGNCSMCLTHSPLITHNDQQNVIRKLVLIPPHENVPDHHTA